MSRDEVSGSPAMWRRLRAAEADAEAMRHVLRRVLEWPLPQGTVESYSLPAWLAREARLALEAGEKLAT